MHLFDRLVGEVLYFQGVCEHCTQMCTSRFLRPLAGDTLMVSRVTTGASFAHSTPQPLFVTPPGAMSQTGFVVSADGQRIYYAAPNPAAAAHEIRVVLNLAGVLMAKSPR